MSTATSNITLIPTEDPDVVLLGVCDEIVGRLTLERDEIETSPDGRVSHRIELNAQAFRIAGRDDLFEDRRILNASISGSSKAKVTEAELLEMVG